MSDFLSNLAARSMGTLETIRPRVPSRYEPVRRADGVLAGRAPAKEESFEGDTEIEGAGDFQIPADSELKTTRGIEADSSSTRARRSVADAGKTRVEADEHRSEIEASEARTVSPVGIEPRIAPRHEAGEARTQSETAQQSRRAERSRPARQSPGVGEMRPDDGSTPSSTPLPDLGRVVAPSVRIPAIREQRNAQPDRAVPAASMKSETEPSTLSSRAIGASAERSEIPTVKPPPRQSIPRVLEPSHTFGVFEDAPRNESVSATARREWPGDAALMPEVKTRPMSGDEAAAFAPPSERAAAERPVAPNRQPALKALAAAQATQSEPSVQVTIGRVEVRAVFPAQPVKRSPPPRFRPSVTLDEYLNRGSGAKR
jgi:hypothetical protein